MNEISDKIVQKLGEPALFSVETPGADFETSFAKTRSEISDLLDGDDEREITTYYTLDQIKAALSVEDLGSKAPPSFDADNSGVVAYMVPRILSFKNVLRTSCPEHLQAEIEGTVCWEPDFFGDSHGVVDKHGVRHMPRPLIYGDLASPLSTMMFDFMALHEFLAAAWEATGRDESEGSHGRDLRAWMELALDAARDAAGTRTKADYYASQGITKDQK